MDACQECWVGFNMADEDEENGKNFKSSSREYKKPLELFEEKKIVRICAPMVRYSK